MPPQQTPIRPAPMKGVERMNTVIVRGPGQEIGMPSRRDLYIMEVNWGRNCYACRGFEHMV